MLCSSSLLMARWAIYNRQVSFFHWRGELLLIGLRVIWATHNSKVMFDMVEGIKNCVVAMVHPSIISHGWIEDVQFLASSFQHIRSLKLPGSELSSCTWGPRSLRIALSIDSFIFFANIRPYYLWTYFGQTLLFSSNQGLLFWDTLSNAVSY